MLLLDKIVLVIGAGRSGKAARDLLLRHKKNALIYDDFVEGLKPEFKMDDVSCVILSPGIDRNHLLVVQALKQNIPILNEMELAALFLPQAKMVGITGTNGKSTSTVMLEEIFLSASLKAKACGNLGVPLSELALLDEKFDYFLIELSSYQLETISRIKLDAAIILNITPDHLDRYKTFEAYKEAKLKIINLLKPDGLLVLNEQIGDVDFFNKIYLTKAIDPQIKQIIFGEHNQENAQACALVATFFGINEQQIIHGLKTFKPLPHRCELVGEHNGIKFINDSKGTTVVAIMKALSMIENPVHLLLGGLDKGEDFSQINQAAFPQIKGYYAFGRAAGKIARELGLKETYSDLSEAFNKALLHAQKGDTVLLSPGCASFDQFNNYAHRGDVFKTLVKLSSQN